jgi:hypothetical protein
LQRLAALAAVGTPARIANTMINQRTFFIEVPRFAELTQGIIPCPSLKAETTVGTLTNSRYLILFL